MRRDGPPIGASLSVMWRTAMVVGLTIGLSACSNTQTEPRPTPTASTVDQGRQDQFCADVADVLTRDDPADPEDQAERLEELRKLASKFGTGSGDDITAARILKSCEDEIRAARS